MRFLIAQVMWLFYHADWDGLCDHLRDVQWEDTFKLGASAGGIYWILWHLVESHSFLWLSAACAIAIAHRNNFFVCTNRINLLYLTWNLDRLVILAKVFLKLPNLLMLIQKKRLSLPRNLARVPFEEKSPMTKNCCHVCLPSVVSNVFEKLVINRLVDGLKICGLISNFQYGFKSSWSTSDLQRVASDRIAKVFWIWGYLSCRFWYI